VRGHDSRPLVRGRAKGVGSRCLLLVVKRERGAVPVVPAAQVEDSVRLSSRPKPDPEQLHARGELVVEGENALGFGRGVGEEGRGLVDAFEVERMYSASSREMP
jgi:hypothetical protein